MIWIPFREAPSAGVSARSRLFSTFYRRVEDIDTDLLVHPPELVLFVRLRSAKPIMASDGPQKWPAEASKSFLTCSNFRALISGSSAAGCALEPAVRWIQPLTDQYVGCFESCCAMSRSCDGFVYSRSKGDSG